MRKSNGGRSTFKTSQRGDFLFNYLYCSQIPDKEKVKFRLLPADATKCPQGVLQCGLYKVHSRKPVKEGDDGEPTTVLATDAYFKPEDPGTPFYIDNILFDLEQRYPPVPDPEKPGAWLTNPEYLKLPLDLREALSDLVGTVEYVFPTAWWLKRVATGTTIKNGKEVTTYDWIHEPNTVEPAGGIWVVRADTVIDQMFDLIDGYSVGPTAERPNAPQISYLSDLEHGHNMVFTRNNYNYNVNAEARPCPALAHIREKLLAPGKYPNLPKMFHEKHMKNDVEQKRLVHNAWYAEDLSKLVSLD